MVRQPENRAVPGKFHSPRPRRREGASLALGTGHSLAAANLIIRHLRRMNLFKALARTSSMTMISRLLGLVREYMNAHQFGAQGAMDAFVIAFRLPNLFRRIFAEGAFSQAFVPILAEYKTQQGDDAAREFLADIAGWLTLALAAFTLLGVIGAPVAVKLLASGFQDGRFDLTVALTRITFPYILLISLSSLVGGVLNTWNRFSVPAFTPALLNISMIGCGYLLSPYFSQPIYALAISVALGGVLQLGYQLPYMRQIGMLTWPRLRRHSPGVSRVLKLMVPAIFGVSAPQISIMLNSNFASHLPEGSVSWMNYADRFMELPNGVLAVALGTILLPSLAKLQAAQKHDEYSAMLDWGLRLCWLLALPATVAMGVIAEPIIATLFLSHKFATHDVLMTAHALSAYAVGLMGLVSIKILAPAYYARQDFKTPVKIGFASVAITQLLNVAFLSFTPLAHAGLALSISLGGCVNAGLLYMGLRRSGVYRPAAGWPRFLLQLLLAVSIMAAVIGVLKVALGGWLSGHVLLRVSKLGMVIIAGAVTYFAALYAMGYRLADFSKRAA